MHIRISEFDFYLHLYSLQHRWRCGDPESSSQSLQQGKSFTNISLPASQIYHTAGGRMNDLCGVAEIEIPQTAGRMSDCFSQFGCDKLSETFWQGKDLSKVTFCVAIQSSFNPLNFKCVPRDISRSLNLVLSHNVGPFLV